MRRAGARSRRPGLSSRTSTTPRRRSITGERTGACCRPLTVRESRRPLTLKPDGTYSLHEEYLERNARFDAEGAYTLHGNLLTLEGSDTTWYKVEENRLRRLTTDRKEVEGPLAEHYVLRKTAE